LHLSSEFLVVFKSLFMRHVPNVFPYTALEEKSCEFQASLSVSDRQGEEGKEAFRPLLAMLRNVLHAAATIVVLVALAGTSLRVLCTGAYADSGILTLKVCHRCFTVSMPAYCRN
jgi:hypothetical protein